MALKQEKLLTPKSASEKYGIDRGKIYYWIKNRRFKFIKPEKEILFWENDLLKFLDDNTVVRDDGEN